MRYLDDYKAVEQQIHDYFGYTEDWKVYPIEDRRGWYWYRDSFEAVHYAESKDNLEKLIAVDFDWAQDGIDSGDCYTDEVISTHPGSEFTALIVDTQTDGNKFFAIYDNAKEILSKEPRS